MGIILKPIIRILEIFGCFVKMFDNVSHFDKGVLKNSRKALFYIIYIIILYTYIVDLQEKILSKLLKTTQDFCIMLT